MPVIIGDLVTKVSKGAEVSIEEMDANFRVLHPQLTLKPEFPISPTYYYSTYKVPITFVNYDADTYYQAEGLIFEADEPIMEFPVVGGEINVMAIGAEGRVRNSSQVMALHTLKTSATILTDRVNCSPGGTGNDATTFLANELLLMSVSWGATNIPASLETVLVGLPNAGQTSLQLAYFPGYELSLSSPTLLAYAGTIPDYISYRSSSGYLITIETAPVAGVYQRLGADPFGGGECTDFWTFDAIDITAGRKFLNDARANSFILDATYPILGIDEFGENKAVDLTSAAASVWSDEITSAAATRLMSWSFHYTTNEIDCSGAITRGGAGTRYNVVVNASVVAGVERLKITVHKTVVIYDAVVETVAAPGIWRHLVYRDDGANLQFILNGTVLVTHALVMKYLAATHTIENLAVGAGSMLVDNFRIFDGYYLTDTDIALLADERGTALSVPDNGTPANLFYGGVNYLRVKAEIYLDYPIQISSTASDATTETFSITNLSQIDDTLTYGQMDFGLSFWGGAPIDTVFQHTHLNYTGV